MKTAPIGAFLNPGTIDEKVGSVIHKNPACFAMFVGANRTVIFQGEWVNTGVPV